MSAVCDIVSEAYREKLVRARTPHSCCECGGAIDPGERYYRVGGICEGQPWNACQHIYCYHFARSLNGISARGFHEGLHPFSLGPEAPDGCISFGGVAEFLGDLSNEFDQATEEPLDHPAERFWDALRSGCREKFEGGSGI